MKNKYLDRDKEYENIVNKIIEFDAEIEGKYNDKIHIVILGGSGIILKFNPIEFRATTDIDVINYYDGKLCQIPNEIRDVMKKYSINDQVSIHMGTTAYLTLFENHITKYEDILLFNTVVYLPSATLVAFTKFQAWRKRASRDDADDVKVKEILKKINFSDFELMVNEYADYEVEFNDDRRRGQYLKEYNEFIKIIKS